MNRLVYLASAFFLLLVTSALGIIDRLMVGEWNGKGGDKITQSLNLLFIFVSIWLFVKGLRGARTITSGAILALAVPALLLCSSLWSFNPTTSIRRGTEYLFVVLAAVGIAGSMEGDEFMDLLAMTCGISAVASIVLRVVSPWDALFDYDSWRGIFSHKNVLGQVMAAGVLGCLHTLRAGGRGALRKYATLVACLGVVMASKSSTSLLASVTYIGLDRMLTWYQNGGIKRFLALFLMAITIPISMMFLLFPDAFFEMIGKDPTLTGRTDLWVYVVNAIADRPLFGWGFYAFWGSDNPAAAEISRAVQWVVPEAHNGLLELLLNVGVIGTAFFIFLWLRNVWLALRCLLTSAYSIAISALLCYVGIALMGVSEAVLVEPFQPTTILFFVTGLTCEKALRSPRHRGYSVHQPNVPAVRLGHSPMPGATGP